MNLRDRKGLLLVASPEEARRMDTLTVTEFGLPGQLLMELAGQGTAGLVQRLRGPRPGHAVILAGRGNNAGDGYVIARHLQDRGWSVTALSLVDVDGLTGDARLNAERFLAQDGALVLLEAVLTQDHRTQLARADVIVDALFGLGLNRPIEGPSAELITFANGLSRPIKVALDLPSGVDAATGARRGVSFRAEHTACYGLPKPGLLLSPGRRDAGTLHVLPIGIPHRVLARVSPTVRLLDEACAASLLPRREASGHKGHHGHVGILGGSTGKEGAAVLAGLGALRGGAGWATWVHGSGCPLAVQRPPELMTAANMGGDILKRATVWVVGPGLGVGNLDADTLVQALESGRPCVLDADALNGLAAGQVLTRPPAVMTPHPGEAARLLGVPTEAIVGDVLAAAEKLVQSFQCVIVLKGAETVVAAPGEPSVVVAEGNATLSTGGTGDVLAGLLASYLGQGLDTRDAALLAVFVHGRAGAYAGLGRAERGVSPREIAEAIPRVVGDLSRVWLDARGESSD